MGTRGHARAEALTPAQQRVVRETRADAEERASDAHGRWLALLHARDRARLGGSEWATADALGIALLREYALAVARVEGCALVADALECGSVAGGALSLPPASLVEWAGELEGWRERDLPGEPQPTIEPAIPPAIPPPPERSSEPPPPIAPTG